MQGFQLTFFTQQDRSHGGKPVAEWIIGEARKLGIRGATMIAAIEGFGRHGRMHSSHFFELADQPLEVTMAVSAEEADRLFARISEERLKVFYIKAPIEFGFIGEDHAAPER
jgi:PII-like signaling protein